METQDKNEKGNHGEKDEILYKKYIFENRANIDFLTNIFDTSACDGIEIINPNTKTPYNSIEQIKKASRVSKPDIIILFKDTNVIRYCSIKSLRGAKPSIVNHTPRSAKVFQTTLHHCLLDIDKIAKEYNDKRKERKIGEDIAFGKLQSFNDENVRINFIEMISYFLFTGTGSRISPNECDSILVINKDGSITFIDCDTDEKKKNYLDSIIHNCIISFRNKGMPTKMNDVCIPWIYTNEITGKLCGSIHVRL